ncbi:MAG TPA: DUF5655 domain-containing protein [Gemmatimonadota bacterium]
MTASKPPAGKPLWVCPGCRRTFANRNQPHACGRHDLGRHFTGRPPEVRDLFDSFLAALEEIGPVEVLPQKTRIAFHVRMSFAQVTPRRWGLDGHFILARRIDDPRFIEVRTFSPRNHLHRFQIETAAEIDDRMRAWMREAYAVGEQRHLD